MKNKTYQYLTSALVISMLSFNLNAQICDYPGSFVWLSNQTEIDSFFTNYPDCSAINANVLIDNWTGSDIIDLSPLSMFTKINGYLQIEGNPGIINLDGFQNIDTITGELVILDNAQLLNLNFDNLKFTGGLRIENNPVLASLQTLEQIDVVDGDVSVFLNASIQSLDGLSGLTTINGDLEIVTCQNLESYVGLDNVSIVQDQLYLSNNDLITDFTGLSSLDSLRNIFISGHELLTSFDGIPTDLYFEYFKVSNNPLLNNCVFEPFCQSLAIGGAVSNNGYLGFSNNGPDCGTDEEVLDACNGKYSLPVQVFIDNNQNSIYDDSDSLMNNIGIELMGENLRGYSSIINPALFYLEPGNYQLRFMEELNPEFSLTTNNSIINVAFPEGGISDTLRFGISPQTNRSEVISFLRTVTALCSETINLDLTTENFGSTTASGTTWIKIDPQLSNYNFPLPPDTISNNLFGWHFSNLNPGSKIKQVIELPIPSIGSVYKSTLFNEAYVSYNDVLGTHTSSPHLYTPKITCIPPATNNIKVSPDQPSTVTPNYVLRPDYIYYTIEFENTTDFEVADVIVEQILDSNLDWNSLKIINTSHPQFLQTSLTNDGLLTFLFRNIFIEDSGDDSQGFIQYAIKTQENLSGPISINPSINIAYGPLDQIDDLMTEEIVSVTSIPNSCFETGAWFTKQIDINDFEYDYPYCTNITGDLRVEETAISGHITDLSPFGILDSIYGNLILRGNEEILNFNGLDNIKYIGGGLTIEENDLIQNFEGLTEVEFIEGNISVLNNPGFNNVEGLDSLNAINDISFVQASGLQSLEALQNLDFINGSISIQGALQLTELTGLESFSSIGGFSMVYCPLVNNLNTFSNIETLNSGGIFLKFNSSLSDLTGLSSVNSMSSLWIENIDLITDFSGLENLTYVGGRFNVFDNDILANANGLNALTEVVGEFNLRGNLLSDLSALSSLTTLGEDFRISSTNVSSLTGLENIETIAGSILLFNNTQLSFCSEDWICNHLLNGGASSFSNNGPGCNSAAEILDNCVDVFTVKSLVFYDLNQNGIQDPGEEALGNTFINIAPQNQLSISNYDAVNTNYLPVGSYIFSIPEINNPLWNLTSNPVTYSVDLVDMDHPDTLFFGLYPNDLAASIQAFAYAPSMRCNSEVSINAIAQNNGTSVIENGILRLTIDERVSSVTFVDQPDIVINDFEVAWNLSTLFPGQSESRIIQIVLPGVEDIDVGELLDFTSSVEYTDIGGGTASTVFEYQPEFVCAYDPNDKLVNPARNGGLTLFEENLTYTIRFQNTGNAVAFDVEVRDTLDENLNPNTFKIIASSHASFLTTTLDEDQYLSFNFRNINLPDSLSDFEGSQGFISYSISPEEGLPEETEILNSASIYFDYNPPILTNITENILVSNLIDPTSVNNSFLNAYSVYPIPAQKEVIFDFKNPLTRNYQIYFYDAYGRLILLSNKRVGEKVIINSSSLTDGYYWYSLIINGEVMNGKILILGN